MSKPVIYEHPLNERVRTLMRLEHLFEQMRHFKSGQASVWDSRVFVTTLMDILDLFSRGDLKTELIKESERAISNLSQHMQHPGVDHERLKSILRALESVTKSLHELKGQLGQSLRDDDFLGAIRQRSAIPGGTCDFDLPAFHQWLHQNAERRNEDISRWYNSLDAIRQAVELLLKLIRNSAEPRQVTAQGGGYQQNLDAAIPYHMIRIALSHEASYYAEISGGKHRFTIRFLETSEGRPVQTPDDVHFKLSCCSL